MEIIGLAPIFEIRQPPMLQTLAQHNVDLVFDNLYNGKHTGRFINVYTSDGGPGKLIA